MARGRMTDDPMPPPSFDKSASAGFLANHMARLFEQALARAIRPLGLAPAQFMALLELWRAEGITQADLCARLDVEQATMAATLNRMQRDGLIDRRPHPQDRRAQGIWLTDRARSLQPAAEAAAAAVNGRALAGLTAADRAAFLTAMSAVIRALQRG